MRRALFLAVGVAAAAASLGVADGGAQATSLTATVGPGFTITLRNAEGARITQVDPGTYEIEVNDLSEEHNFHLSGPGVNRATSVEGTGTERWTVTFTEGRYSYVCDPHAGEMNGGFVVGNPPASSPPPGANVVTARTRVVLTSGPGFTIALRTAAGRRVTRMRVGTYTMTVRDRSRMHNARVRAPGYNRATTLSFVGRQTWRVRLRRTGTLRFLCDPHASQGMRGSARIVR